jgi:hypothetical protein
MDSLKVEWGSQRLGEFIRKGKLKFPWPEQNDVAVVGVPERLQLRSASRHLSADFPSKYDLHFVELHRRHCRTLSQTPTVTTKQPSNVLAEAGATFPVPGTYGSPLRFGIRVA